MKIRRLYIHNLKLFQDFNLDFTCNDKAQNLVIIAGLNGSGKTTLFKDFIFQTFKKKNIINDSFIEIEQKEGNDKRVYTIDNERLKSDFADTMMYSNNIRLPKYENIIFYEAGISDKKNVKDTILQFIDNLIYEKDKKSSEAYSITQNVLNSIFKDFKLQIEFKGIDRNKEVLFKNDSAEKIKIEDLSGGEQELITKAFALHLSGIEDSIILIDEPESSLHPSWQNRIAQVYQNFADKNDNQIILATHSPHIVASVRKEQIRVLAQEEKNTVRAIDNFNGSYGWKIDKVLLEIFRMKELRTPPVEKKLHDLSEMVSRDNYESIEFKKLQKELELTVGYDDMDLMLIRMEIARRRSKK